MDAGQVKGKQRASQAANGVDLSVGSAAEVRASTDIITEIDKQQIETNAIRAMGLPGKRGRCEKRGRVLPVRSKLDQSWRRGCHTACSEVPAKWRPVGSKIDRLSR